jgi:hypothetical protein
MLSPGCGQVVLPNYESMPRVEVKEYLNLEFEAVSLLGKD